MFMHIYIVALLTITPEGRRDITLPLLDNADTMDMYSLLFGTILGLVSAQIASSKSPPTDLNIDGKRLYFFLKSSYHQSH